MKVDPNAALWPSWIGQAVVKKSGKPFKSGDKTATVKAFTVNPNTGHPGFSFYEDESVVDCRTTQLKERTE